LRTHARTVSIPFLHTNQIVYPRQRMGKIFVDVRMHNITMQYSPVNISDGLKFIAILVEKKLDS
jgi:hypothetical protein